MATDLKRRNASGIFAFLFAMFAVIMFITGKTALAIIFLAMMIICIGRSRKAAPPDASKGTQPPVGEGGKVP